MPLNHFKGFILQFFFFDRPITKIPTNIWTYHLESRSVIEKYQAFGWSCKYSLLYQITTRYFMVFALKLKRLRCFKIRSYFWFVSRYGSTNICYFPKKYKMHLNYKSVTATSYFIVLLLPIIFCKQCPGPDSCFMLCGCAI